MTGKEESFTLQITPKKLTEAELEGAKVPVVKTVTVSITGNSENKVKKGTSDITCTAAVTGDNLGDNDKKVTWAIKETNKSASTTISADGKLTVDKDEVLNTITITATSQTKGADGQAVVGELTVTLEAADAEQPTEPESRIS